jgi:transcriptional regulator with XRE-family HTH domain
MKFLNVDPKQFIFADESVAARKLADPKDANYDEFLQLKKAISDQGLLNTFSVTQRDNGFLIIDGNRRGLAVQQLWAEGDKATRERYPEGVPVQVLDASDADVLLSQISGNANVNKQKAASLGKALHRALLMTNITITELSKRSGISEAYVEQLLKLNLLPTEVKAMIDAGEITATNAFHLNRLPTELLNQEMIDQAKIKSGADFCNHVDAAKKAFLAAKKAGETPGAGDGEILFSPTPKLRMKAELEGMRNLALERAKLEPTEANIAYANAMDWCFRMDEETLESDRAAFELAKKDKEKKAAERAAERAAKKRKELLESLAGDPNLAKELAELSKQVQ